MSTLRHDLGPFALVPEYVVDTASPLALKAWCKLWIYTGNGTHDAWPSQPRLAADLACSRRSVQRALDELVELGAVAVQVRPGTSNLYTLQWSPTDGGRATGGAGSATHDAPGRATDGAGVAPRVAHEERQSEIENRPSVASATTPHVRHPGDAPLTRGGIREIRARAVDAARHERETRR